MASIYTSPMSKDMGQLFMCLLAIHKLIFFGKMCIQILCLFLIELLALLGCRNSLSKYKSFVRCMTFSHSVVCLFIFLMLSFELQTFIILMVSSIFFSVMDCVFGVRSKKPLPSSRSQMFSPVFSSRIFIVLILKFRPIIHFELIFTCRVRV